MGHGGPYVVDGVMREVVPSADAGRGAETGAASGLAVLGEAACWALLPRTGVGRLAWVAPDGRILVVPVNYGLDGRTVVLRTGDTDLLDAARARVRVAFQVEDIEPGLRSGWTVL